jgi:hypothetical protein
MQVKYIANYDEAKKPVVALQVAESLLGRTADEGKESRQGTHLKRLPMRVAFKPLFMNAAFYRQHRLVLRPFRRRDYFKCRGALALICLFGRRALDNSKCHVREAQFEHH